MGALLKALGMAIWALVALGLLAVFTFVGYEAALKFRSPGAPIAEHPGQHIESSLKPELADLHRDTGTQTSPESNLHGSASKPTALEAARKRFDDAAEQRRFGAVLDAGKQLYDAGLTRPEDLRTIAHAFSAMGDCDNALVWAERANDALRTVGMAPNELSDPIRLPCRRGVTIKNFSTNAWSAKTTLADRFVRLGELYYGFGDYQQAIISIQRGLDMGGVSHLDDAYVYLGRAELKLNNTPAACRSFESLRDLPNLPPRIIELWLLFADMHC